MTHTIVVASVKGGTGKTTTTLNLAVALAEKGHSVVIVDLDPQGSIGLALAQKDTEWVGLAEYLMDAASLEDAVLKTKMNGLSILPRGRLNAVDVGEYEQALYNGDALVGIVKKLSGQYDFILMDTPSGLGMITRAAMRAGAYLLTPLQAEPLALRSVSQLLRVAEHVRQNENADFRLLGILPTMVNLENDASMDVMNTVWSGFGGILDTYIPRADVFATANAAGVPVDFLPGKKRPEARRFEKLSMELELLIAQMGDEIEGANERVERRLV
ncbi:MAG: ParA family protein [Deltaproteobacteria bacterium]|nr:ParA family protein [Deltaproteobacteria bacterium]